MFCMSVCYLLLVCVTIDRYGIVESLHSIKFNFSEWLKSPKVPLFKKVHAPNKYYSNNDTYTSEEELQLNLTDEDKIRFKIWPQGVIPYYIDTYSYKDKVLRDRIHNFLSEVNSLSNINFVALPRPPSDNETRWVFFVNRRSLLGCSDHPYKSFTTKGIQHVTLGYDCMSTRNELAEAVLSIVGIPPQHNAPNRDDYIEVITENIIPEKRYLFEKINNKDWPFRNVEYDFKSAGHFDTHKHSLNGKATIRVRKPVKSKQQNEKNTLSTLDVRKIKMLYNWMNSENKLRIDVCQRLLKFKQSPIKKLLFKAIFKSIGKLLSSIFT